ncbi:MAG: MBL fold metallo-hydrolase [Nitrososphaerales archaeon]
MKIENSELVLEQVPVGSHKNFCYIVADRKSCEAIVIDPAWEIELIKNKIDGYGLKVDFIINTHAHFDHIEGNQKLGSLTNAKVGMHESSLAKKDFGVSDDQVIKLGNAITLRFIHTPGHSPESMCIIVNDLAILTGDTLFIGECGRSDLHGGDANALYDSFEKIRGLNKDLIVCPGHNYGPKTSSTLAEELATNYTLTKRLREDFIYFMNAP